MVKPRFSVITICFNASSTIERTIESVLNQTFSDFEYIIVDGGSVDDTLSIIKKYQDSVSKFVSEKDEGISDAFNKGISMASGEWITLINADDWFEIDALEVVDAFVTGGNFEVVCSNMKFWKGNQILFSSKSNPSLLSYNMTVNHMGSFIKKDLYEKYGGYSTEFRLAMDYDLFLRIRKKGIEFAYLDRDIVNMSADGVSDRLIAKSYKEVLRSQINNGNNRLLSYFMYCFKWLKHKTRLILEKIGLSKLVSLYQSHFTVRSRGDS